MKQLIVKSRTFDYPIIFEENLSAVLKKLSKENKIHILIDKNVAKHYDQIFQNKNTYASFKEFTPVEDKKNIQEISSYIQYLLNKNIHKDHKLVVIGGGLVQDIGSFVAHILLRGIDWVFVPTTLLAMADSCVGSKSGINVGKYKNQIGSFHPPSKIYIYLPFIDSLPKSEFINGIGEIIKHALIKGGRQFDFISKNVNKLKTDKNIASKIIYNSLLIKKEIVEKDEFEKNIRKVLNYGHTFGHALEGYTKHAIPHGVGVLIGMDLANFISLKKHMLSLAAYKSLHALIYQYTKAYNVKINDYDSYMDFLSHDKKVLEGNKVNAILSKGIGSINITKLSLDNSLKKIIREFFLKNEN